VATQKQEANAKQKVAVARITKIDPEAAFEVIGGWVQASYVPAWERSYNDRAVENPTRITFALDESGRIHGWGFTSPTNFARLLKACPFAEALTKPEDMAEVLKARAAARRPTPEPEAEATREPEKPKVEKPKATPKRRSGVQVVSK
jgi:hypothetical protein